MNPHDLIVKVSRNFIEINITHDRKTYDRPRSNIIVSVVGFKKKKRNMFKKSKIKTADEFGIMAYVKKLKISQKETCTALKLERKARGI